ncbi:MAG: hypothetical protein ACR2I0_00125 [Rhodoferax sp.]
MISLDIFDLSKVGTDRAFNPATKFISHQENIMSASTLHLHAHSSPAVDLTHLRSAAREVAQQLKAIALFAVAPFIGLVYAALMPFVGLGMLAIVGYKAFAKSSTVRQAMASTLKALALVAAPVIGLLYAVALPFIGLALIAKVAYQAARA